MQPGNSVSCVARQYRVSVALLYKWVKFILEGGNSCRSGGINLKVKSQKGNVMICSKYFMIKEFVNALQHKRGILFVGSGISLVSGFGSWKKLLKSFYPKIFKMSYLKYTFPQIAQFMANEFDAFSLKKYISEMYYTPSIESNKYINYIKRMNISKIWTTNYDTLIEDAYGRKSCVVRIGDINIATPQPLDKVEIIKMHGCVTSIKDIIITQDDYDFYQLNYPNICRRLITDLNENNFLFIGYGFNDPNIHNILRTSQWNGRMPIGRHYLITKKSEDKMQDIWAKNLARFGIHTVYIENYMELETILEEISYKSRGKRIFVSGSHKIKNTELIIKFSNIIAEIIAHHNDVILMDGQSEGIGSVILNQYITFCSERKIERINRIESFPNPYSLNPKLSSNEELIPMLKSFREDLFRKTQLFIVFDGGIGTRAEFDLAKKFGCKIFPIPIDYSPLIDEIIKDKYVKNYMKKFNVYFNKINNKQEVTIEDIKSNLSKAIKEL